MSLVTCPDCGGKRAWSSTSCRRCGSRKGNRHIESAEALTEAAVALGEGFIDLRLPEQALVLAAATLYVGPGFTRWLEQAAQHEHPSSGQSSEEHHTSTSDESTAGSTHEAHGADDDTDSAIAPGSTEDDDGADARHPALPPEDASYVDNRGGWGWGDKCPLRRKSGCAIRSSGPGDTGRKEGSAARRLPRDPPPSLELRAA